MIIQEVTGAAIVPYDEEQLQLTISYSLGSDEVVLIRRSSLFIETVGEQVKISWNNYGANPKFEFRYIDYSLFTYPVTTSADSLRVTLQQMSLPYQPYYRSFQFL